MKLELADTLAILDLLLTRTPTTARDGGFSARLQRLRDLVDETKSAEPTFAAIAGRVFPGVSENSLRTTFPAFRDALAAAAEAAGQRLALVKPASRGLAPSGIRCHFEGDSLSRHRLVAEARAIESVSREGVAASGPNAYIPMQAFPDEPLVFVSFAVAETALVDRFMRQLIENLKPQCRHKVKFWRFDEVTSETGIVPGEENEAEIRKAMAKCQFGLLLISPAYVNRPFIERVELPHFTGQDAKAPAVPVALADWTPGSDKDPRFDSKNVFALEGKPYNQLSTPRQKAEFVKTLAKRIEAFIDRARVAAGGDVEAAAPGEAPAESHETRRFADGQIDEEERKRLLEFRHLDAQHEAALGKGSGKSPEPPDEPSRDGAVNLISTLMDWANGGAKTSAYLALLGETGAGKTMTCLEFTRLLLDDWKTDPLVIYLDLRRANEDGLLKRNPRPLLAEIMESVLRRTGSGRHANAEELLRAVRERHAVLIWDGLDEVLVHLSHDAGQAFFRQLLEALPPRLVDKPGAGRLLFACRTQYFRDLDHEADLFTGGQKEGIPVDGGRRKGDRPVRASFTVLRVLPFSDEQIRGYLAANVPGLDVDRAIEVIHAVHNLRELAGRPYLLSLMRESLTDCDADLAAGRTVRSVDLYERLVNRWLEREKTREAISRGHKRRLMQLLAAHFWREGIRSLPVDALDSWLEKLVVTDPFFAAAMGQLWGSSAEARDTLCEHLRAATFLGRWEGASFRFAHTSLLEFFLASDLADALEEGNADAWSLPMPSRETLGFLAEQCIVRRLKNPAAGRRMDATLSELLAKCQPGRSENAFAFLLRLHATGESDFAPAACDLRGLDLTAWEIAGTPGRPLRLAGADFSGATLIRARLHHVEMPGSRWAGADLCSAEFLGCGLEKAEFAVDGTRLEGVRFRACRLSGSRIAGADLAGTRVELPVWDAATEQHWRDSLASQPAGSTAPGPPNHPFSAPPEACWSLGHAIGVRSVGFSADGRRLVSGSSDKTVRIWDAQSGQLIRVLGGHADEVWSVGSSPDGRRLVSGSTDNTVRVWDAESGQLLRVLEGHAGWVLSVGFSPDGRRLVSGSGDQTVRVWDAESGQLLRVLEGHANWVWSVGFSPDGRRLVSGSADNTVRVWDAESGQLLRVLEGHAGWVLSVGFSPDGRRLVSGSGDQTVRVWDVESGQLLRVLEGHAGWIVSVGFSPDGRRLVSGSSDKTVRIWDAESGQLLRVIEGHAGMVKSVGFSPDGRRLVSGSADKTVRVWDVGSGQLLRVLEGHANWVWSVGSSPDGGRLVSGSVDKTVRVWDAESGQLLSVLEGHAGLVNSVGFSPDGRRLVSASSDKTVCVWDAESGQLLSVLEGHAGLVNSVGFSPDGRRLVSASSDKTVCVWDAESGQLIRVLGGHADEVRSIEFSPDGSRIVSGSADKTVRVWDAQSGAALEVTRDDERALRERGGRAGRAVSVSPLRSIRWTSDDGTQFDVAPLPDGGFLALKKTAAEPRWRIAAARGEYWRHVNYATDDERGRILWSADVCGAVIGELPA